MNEEATNDPDFDHLSTMIGEFGGFEDLVEVRWVTDEGETVMRDPRRGNLFGDHPELVREATFVFGSGARITVDYSEARDD